MIGAASVPGSRDLARIVKLGLEGDSLKVQDQITACSDGCGGAILSPTGQRIAYQKHFKNARLDTLANGRVIRRNQVEIYIMNADGTGRQALTDKHWFMTPVAWSPDGTQILVYASDRNPNYAPPYSATPKYIQQILRVAPDGSGVTDITPFADTPVAKPEPSDWKR